MSILGYVIFNGKKLSFNLSDFYVKVMQDNNRVFFPEKLAIDKFIYGITDNGYPIAFQTGMAAYNHMQYTGFPISSYIIDEGNATYEKFDTFEKIQFYGGTLNCLMPPQAAYDNSAMMATWKQEDKEKKQENYKIELLPFNKISKEVNVSILGKQATYNRYPCFSHNTGTNIALKIFNVIEFKFKEAQPIELIQQCYKFAFNYISFLVGHKDIHFDNVYISKTIVLRDQQLTKRAKVFIQTKPTGDGTTTANKTIQLNWFDKYIQNFITIYENKDAFNLDFLPDNEEVSHYVSIDLVKKLCTAFEIEYYLDAGNKPNNDIIKQLSKIVIKDVNAFKKENPMLSKKFYSLIMTNIGNWSLPLSEKILYLYTANKNIMDAFIKNKGWFKCQIDDASIGKFVKARNNSTHGNQKGIDKDDVEFIYLMKVMIYALIMKRLGFEEETTINILDRIF